MESDSSTLSSTMQVNYWQTDEKSSGDLQNFESNLIFGFQLATLAGPLCEEPLRAVAFTVCDWKLMNIEDKLTSYGPLSGQIMSTMKDCCRKAFQVRNAFGYFSDSTVEGF